MERRRGGERRESGAGASCAVRPPAGHARRRAETPRACGGCACGGGPRLRVLRPAVSPWLRTADACHAWDGQP